MSCKQAWWQQRFGVSYTSVRVTTAQFHAAQGFNCDSALHNTYHKHKWLCMYANNRWHMNGQALNDHAVVATHALYIYPKHALMLCISITAQPQSSGNLNTQCCVFATCMCDITCSAFSQLMRTLLTLSMLWCSASAHAQSQSGSNTVLCVCRLPCDSDHLHNICIHNVPKSMLWCCASSQCLTTMKWQPTTVKWQHACVSDPSHNMRMVYKCWHVPLLHPQQRNTGVSTRWRCFCG
jgi:hypothetical protein